MNDEQSVIRPEADPASADGSLQSVDERAQVDVAADEFAERYRNGEYPSVTEYVDRYPEQADELRELLPAVAMMEQLKRKEDSRISAIESQPSVSGIKQLGDFRIIREIGHGGMGVVYEAVQESLGRRVALKVLSPAMLGSEKTIRRFRREAETVARLHHTNIVPVFGVGEEKGLHYYVMQLIDGEPLNEVISQVKHQSKSTATSSRTSDNEAEQTNDSSDSQPRGTDSIPAELFGDESVSVAGVDSDAIALSGDSTIPDRESLEAQPDPHVEVTGERWASAHRPAVTSADTDGLTSAARLVKAGFDASEATVSSAASLADASSFDRPATEGEVVASERLGPMVQTGEYWDAAARIGVQVARALDYAHRQGVWHRDIKPSNLLIDGHGSVWLVDFGLARIAEENELTQTGDLVGTLRYMSPEQVVGDFDQRSDVYSLGLTLYELLTFRPAHDASIRSRIMQQINEARPKSPREINPDIPRDLETIILKATAHDADARFQTAGQLADDLQRFVDGYPIKARRTSQLEQLWRWSRRNPALATTSATTLLLLIVVAAVSLWGFVTTQQAYSELAEERGRTSEQRDRAEGNLSLALLAFEEIVEGISQRGVPQSVQSDLVTTFDSEGNAEGVAVEPSAPVPMTVVTEADAELLNRLLKFYQDFSKRNESSPQVAAQTAKAQRRIGDIYRRLGRYEESIAAFENSQQRYRELSRVELDPDPLELLIDPEFQPTYESTLAVARISNELGGVAAQSGDPRRAGEHYFASIQYLKNLPSDVNQRADARFLLAQTLNEVSTLRSRIGTDVAQMGFGGPGGFGDGGDRHRGGRPERADGSRGGPPDFIREMMQKAADHWRGKRPPRDRGPGEGERDNHGPDNHRDDRGRPGGYRGQPEESFALFVGAQQEALSILDQLIEAEPSNPEYQVELARALMASVSSFSRSGWGGPQLSDESLDHTQQAIEILEGLVKQHPGNPEFRFQLADTLAFSAFATRHSRSHDETAATFEQSVQIARGLRQQFPNVPEYEILLASALRHLSGLQNDQSLLDESRESVSEAVTILRDLTRISPNHAVYRLSLARALQHSAMLERRMKLMDSSLEQIAEAIQLLDGFESDEGMSPQLRGFLSVLYRNQSELYGRKGLHDEAEAARRKSEELSPVKGKWQGGPPPRGRGYGPPRDQNKGDDRQRQKRGRPGPPGRPPGPPSPGPPKSERPPEPEPSNNRPERDRTASRNS